MPETTPTQNDPNGGDPSAPAIAKPELSRDDRLKILYETFFENEISSSPGLLYKLSWAESGVSGLSFGVNQVDMGQPVNVSDHEDLRKRVDAYVLANPALHLSTLTDIEANELGFQRISNKIDGDKKLIPLTEDEKAHNKKLETLRDNKAIASYLVSPASKEWVESKTGSYVQKNILDTLVTALGGFDLGKKILNDPEMLSLTAQALNNAGSISELAKLLKTGRAQFRRIKPNDEFTLTEDERRDGVGVDRLREMLQHEYRANAPIENLDKFGAPDDGPTDPHKSTFTNTARHVKDLFEQHLLPSPPPKFLNPDSASVSKPQGELPPRPQGQRHSLLQQGALGPAIPAGIDVNDPLGVRWPTHGAAPGSLDITTTDLPDISIDPKSPRDLSSLVFPPKNVPNASTVAGLDSEFSRPAPSFRLFGDDADRANDESRYNGYLSSLPAPTKPEPAIASAPKPDYDRITREVMRRMADEGNRPPRGILFDPSATVPFMAP